MAHIDTSGKGRNTNVDLNLVPFIDLMSVLITFLLISAVWTQVSMIQLGASFASPKDSTNTEYKVPPHEDLVFRLDVVSAGYVLKFGTQTKPIPKRNNEYDTQTLLTELQRVKQAYPDKNNVKISIADEILYENVIAAMDTGLQAGFSPELLTGGPR
ncbi:ExbD/TolR family protein [Pseudobdellovibrio exovorus]|uniref:TolR protein n=1 Tax=Pseudobdellovibrio exovorus JSS TaxID=1184267 RepID=M4V6X7_9BACT|nr:biopolymer transporter ExbD [Pseudobdellovibrio exovorus]AGH94953.1 tolR protein [Pseudobdellovibrio exovorus JSS]